MAKGKAITTKGKGAGVQATTKKAVGGKKVKGAGTSDPFLAEEGLYAARTTSNGNCLFNALSVQMYGTERRHAELRAGTCDFMEAHIDELMWYVQDDDEEGTGPRRNRGRQAKKGNAGTSTSTHSPWNELPEPDDLRRKFCERLARMRSGGTWGNEQEIAAFAAAYACRTHVYQKGQAGSMVYGPQLGEGEGGRTSAYIFFDPKGQHYETLRNVDGPHEGLPDVFHLSSAAQEGDHGTAKGVADDVSVRSSSSKRSFSERDDDEGDHDEPPRKAPVPKGRRLMQGRRPRSSSPTTTTTTTTTSPSAKRMDADTPKPSIEAEADSIATATISRKSKGVSSTPSSGKKSTSAATVGKSTLQTSSSPGAKGGVGAKPSVVAAHVPAAAAQPPPRRTPRLKLNGPRRPEEPKVAGVLGKSSSSSSVVTGKGAASPDTVAKKEKRMMGRKGKVAGKAKMVLAPEAENDVGRKQMGELEVKEREEVQRVPREDIGMRGKGGAEKKGLPKEARRAKAMPQYDGAICLDEEVMEVDNEAARRMGTPSDDSSSSSWSVMANLEL